MEHTESKVNFSIWFQNLTKRTINEQNLTKSNSLAFIFHFSCVRRKAHSIAVTILQICTKVSSNLHIEFRVSIFTNICNTQWNYKRSVNFERTCWYPEFSQKMNKIIQPTVLWLTGRHVFICFLGELKTPKVLSKLTEL